MVYSDPSTLTGTGNPSVTISYDASPYCRDISTAQAVTFLNGMHTYTGGTFTADSGNLNIDANTGAITPNLSTDGTYLVTYTIPATGQKLPAFKKMTRELLGEQESFEFFVSRNLGRDFGSSHQVLQGWTQFRFKSQCFFDNR